MSAVKYLAISIALVLAIGVFSAVMMTDTVQILINGEPLPHLPTLDQSHSDNQPIPDYAEQIIQDHQKIPQQVGGTGQNNPNAGESPRRLACDAARRRAVSMSWALSVWMCLMSSSVTLSLLS